MEVSRKSILNKAIHDCFKEMYAKSQPSADWDQIIKEFEEGKRDKNERVYEQHYLSQEEYTYIVEKYIDAYNIKAQWKDDVEIVEEYLSKGGSKDKYFKDKYDKDGNLIEPGYRGYEKVDPLCNHIKKILKDGLGENWHEIADEKANKITDKVMELINTCKDFYKFDREESSFRITCALGASPTSNPETVKKYWKEKTGEDIHIEYRNPKLFWYIDEGYTDDELAYEFEDYGENWKKALDKEWKDELDKRAQERNAHLKQLESNFSEENGQKTN